MKKNMISAVTSLSVMVILFFATQGCSPLQPESSGAITISLISPGEFSVEKTMETVRLSRLHCILTESGVKVRDNDFFENDGYFTIIYRDLPPGNAYHLMLYAGITASSMDATAEQDSIVVKANNTTNIELVLHSLVPAPVAPENGACLTGPDITFEWDATEYPDGYMLYVATDSLFKSPILIETEIIDKEYMLSGCSPPRTLYWRVSSKYKGGYSMWSEARYVTIN